MIRIYCDICNSEIKKDELGSGFNYIEKAQILVEGQIQSNIQRFEQVFCEKCTDEIKKKRDEMVK